MSSVSAQLTNVVNNTHKLLKLCVSLREENDLLKSELHALKENIEASTSANKQLEERLKALTVAKSLEVAAGDKEVINEKILDTKQKINDFVREIDKCIELLK